MQTVLTGKGSSWNFAWQMRRRGSCAFSYEQYYMNRDDHDDKRVNVTQGIRHIVMNPDAKLGLLKLPENCKTKLQSGKWLVKDCFTDALQSHVENSLRQFTDYALQMCLGLKTCDAGWRNITRRPQVLAQHGKFLTF